MIFAIPLQPLPSIDFKAETSEYLLRQIVKLWGISWVRRMLERLLIEPANAELLWMSGGTTTMTRCYLLRQGDIVELQLWVDDRFVSSTRFDSDAIAYAAAEAWQKDLT